MLLLLGHVVGDVDVVGVVLEGGLGVVEHEVVVGLGVSLVGGEDPASVGGGLAVGRAGTMEDLGVEGTTN